VRSHVNANETATFLMAAIEGYVSLAKNSQDARTQRSGKRHVIRHLESLAPGSAAECERRRGLARRFLACNMHPNYHAGFARATDGRFAVLLLSTHSYWYGV
jgi:hypothetical protein